MVNSEMQGFLDGIVEQYNELQEKRIIEEAKKIKMIKEAVLIMNPKHKRNIMESGLSNTTILWSEHIEEDKAYMVTDANVILPLNIETIEEE